MRIFRNINAIELKKLIDNNFIIYPKPFKSNKDSYAPCGIWSFWFKKPVQHIDRGGIIVSADVSKLMLRESIMFFTIYSDEFDTKYSIKEYYTDQPIRIDYIFIITSEIEDGWEFEKAIKTEDYEYEIPFPFEHPKSIKVRVIDWKKWDKWDIIYQAKCEEIYWK